MPSTLTATCSGKQRRAHVLRHARHVAAQARAEKQQQRHRRDERAEHGQPVRAHRRQVAERDQQREQRQHLVDVGHRRAAVQHVVADRRTPTCARDRGARARATPSVTLVCPPRARCTKKNAHDDRVQRGRDDEDGGVRELIAATAARAGASGSLSARTRLQRALRLLGLTGAAAACRQQLADEALDRLGRRCRRG